MAHAIFKNRPGPSLCGIRRGFRKVNDMQANRRHCRFEKKRRKGFGTTRVVIRSDTGVN